MMNIKKLLNKHRGKTVEFKRDLSSLQPILKTIVAFANTAGGTLIIGKEDDSKLKGITDLQKQQDKLANAIVENIHPMIFPEFEFFTVDGKHLLLVHIHHIPAPFYLKKEGDVKGVYLRLGATTRRASMEIISELKRRVENQYFDEQPCFSSLKSDIDMSLLKSFFSNSKYKLSTDKLITLKIIRQFKNKQVLTNGGVLLFGKEAKRLEVFPNSEISCARFVGKNKADFIDRLDITDSLLFAIDQVAKFIRRNTSMAADFSEITRRDIPEYPIEAIREVLINAFVHANFEIKNSRFYIAIYSDRLEIQNPGNWLPGITFDDFKSGISKLRNPMIARIFREKEKIEAWGSGFQRIMSICEEQDYPIPVWEEMGSILRVTFRPSLHRNRKYKVKTSQESRNIGIKPGSSWDQDGIKLGSRWDQAGIKIEKNSIEYKILVFCKEPQKLSMIQDNIGLKSRAKFKIRYINVLLEGGLLEMTVPDKPKSPNQHYKTTEYGYKLLE